MKIGIKTLLTTGLLVFFSNNTYSQISFGKNGTFSNKWHKGDLVLHSGDTLNGWLKFESATKGMAGLGSKTNKVFYKKTKKGENKKYKKEDFSSFTITKNDKKVEKYATVYTSKKKIQLLKVLAEGKVIVYEAISRVNNSTFNTHTGNWGNNYSYEYVNMYIKREDEKIASNEFFVNIFKSFKKTAKRYFLDCTELINKIDNDDFKKKRLIEIVEYYNTKCN